MATSLFISISFLSNSKPVTPFGVRLPAHLVRPQVKYLYVSVVVPGTDDSLVIVVRVSKQTVQQSLVAPPSSGSETTGSFTGSGFDTSVAASGDNFRGAIAHVQSPAAVHAVDDGLVRLDRKDGSLQALQVKNL